ncbi:MAG: hypothetical protein KGR24_10305, partial [Planctomycetes bacterium]|nr:hypothetical protein [Planctomycetota bacterium]
HLAGATIAAPGEPCEIDLVIRPGTGRFTREAECRLALVVPDQRGQPNQRQQLNQRRQERLDHGADVTVTVFADDEIAAALAAAG